MKTKRLFNALLVAGFAAALAACSTKEQIEGNGLGFNDAEFKIELTKVGQTGATLTLSSSDAKAPFYGFLTDDLKSKSSELVEEFVDGMSDINTSVVWTKKKVLPISGLCQGGHPYRFIMTGLLPNGDIYHEPVEVVFTTEGEYVKNPAWVVTYPDPEFDPTTLEVSGTKGYYVYGVKTKEEFAATTIKEIVLQELIEGVQPINENKAISLPLAETGDYTFYMYGVTEEGFPTLEYQTFDFTIANLDFSSYEAFLGEWYVDGDPNYVLTISELKRGLSFNISGIAGNTNSKVNTVEAKFDMASATLSLYEQIVAETKDPEEGAGFDVLSGVFTLGTTNYRAFPFNSDEPLLIFTATIDDEGKIVTVPNEFTLYGYDLIFSGIDFSFAAETGDSFYYGSITPLPMTLVSEPATPSEAYSKWLGTWYDATATPFEIKQANPNKTFKIAGFLEDYEVMANYDEENDQLVFYGNQVVGSTSNGNLLFIGRDQDGYLEPGTQDGNYTLARASWNEDGESFTIVGEEYTAIYSGKEYEEIIVSMTLFLTDGSSYYTTEANVIALPAEMTPVIPEASEEFLAWIGDWNVVRVPADEENEIAEVVDTWTFKELKLNSSYVVTGIEGLDWAAVEVGFEADEEGSYITGYEQTVLENDVITIDFVQDGYLTPTIIADYGYYGTPFWGEINEDGTATLYTNDRYVYNNKGLYSCIGVAVTFEGTTGDFTTRWTDTPTYIDAETGLTLVKVEEEEGEEGEEESVGSVGINDGFRVPKAKTKAQRGDISNIGEAGISRRSSMHAQKKDLRTRGILGGAASSDFKEAKLVR